MYFMLWKSASLMFEKLCRISINFIYVSNSFILFHTSQTNPHDYPTNPFFFFRYLLSKKIALTRKSHVKNSWSLVLWFSSHDMVNPKWRPWWRYFACARQTYMLCDMCEMYGMHRHGWWSTPRSPRAAQAGARLSLSDQDQILYSQNLWKENLRARALSLLLGVLFARILYKYGSSWVGLKNVAIYAGVVKCVLKRIQWSFSLSLYLGEYSVSACYRLFDMFAVVRYPHSCMCAMQMRRCQFVWCRNINMKSCGRMCCLCF